MPARQLHPDPSKTPGSPARRPAKVDIYAIHGPNPWSAAEADHAWDTWRTPPGNDGHLWLRDELPQYLPDSRIFLYQYNATAVFGKDRQNFVSKASELLETIRTKSEDESRPTLLLGHSMGGLLIKQALVNAQNNSKYTFIRDAVTGVAFFATPHAGGEWKRSTIGTLTAAIAEYTGFQQGKGAMEPLKSDTMFADTVAEYWREHIERCVFVSFWGTQDHVVPEKSAKLMLGTLRENVVSLHADHSTVCKFGHSEADRDNFEKVVKNLRDLYEAAIKLRSKPRFTDAEQKLIERLPGHDIGSFLNSQEEPLTSSFDWIHSCEEFRTFLSSSDTHVLRIVAEPGSGKSTAAAWLFRNIHSWDLRWQPLLFSFHGKPSASAAWSSLLYQLLHLDGTPSDTIQDALEIEDQLSRWNDGSSPSEIWTKSRLRDVFKSVVGRLRDGFRTLYIIDALDECDATVSRFLESIVDILRARPSSQAKFLFLGRQTSSPLIDSLFKSVGGTFAITMNENPVHMQNVNRYIQIKVDELCELRPGMDSLRPMIVKELNIRSAGMYLYASLTLKSLAKEKATPSNVGSIVRTLPKDLQAIYSNALDKVAAGERDTVSALLLWVVFAVQPLRIWELSAAIAITCQDLNTITIKNDLEDEVSRSPLGDPGIIELVGTLIRVTGGDLVSLVHSSARQYLLGLAPYREPHKWIWGWLEDQTGRRGDSVPAMASGMLYIKCQAMIAFASRADISSLPPDSASDETPSASISRILYYAIENVPDHVRQSPPGEWVHGAFASFLASQDGTRWMRQFRTLTDPGQGYKDFPPLAFCCALGLVETAKQLLPLNQYPRAQLSDVQGVENAATDATQLLTAADLAAMYGNVDILRVLCEDMGTPVDSNNLIPQTSWKKVDDTRYIHLGQNRGYPDVPVPAQGTDGGEVIDERQKVVEQLSWYRPLHTATTYGHVEAAEYLISRGASISLEDEFGKWPIEIAVEKKIRTLAQLLLQKHEEAVLSLVRRFVKIGHPTNIEQLLHLRPEFLANGVPMLGTAFGEHNGSILHVAAACGEYAVYEILIRLGASHGLKDSEGRQAIHYAAASAQSEIIKSMLIHGEGGRAEHDASGRNVLFYATLGASCCDCWRWTSIAQREQVISVLCENVDTTDVQAWLSSALRSLANFSYETQDSLSRTLEKCLTSVLSRFPDIAMDGAFLPAAFESTFFPLDLALKLARDAINDTDGRGRTALHTAAAGKREWGAWHKELVGKVANIDQADAYGKTALRLAIDSAKPPEVSPRFVLARVKSLVEHGANVTCADLSGLTPITAAVQYLVTVPNPRSWTYPRAVEDGLLTSLLARDSGVAESISGSTLPRLIAALATSRRTTDLRSLIRAISTRQRSQWLAEGLVTAPITTEVLFICHELGWPPAQLSMILSHFDDQQVQQACDRALDGKSRIIAEMCRPRVKNYGGDGWLLRPCLIDAARHGSKETLEIFLDVLGGNVDAKDTAGQTLLSLAVEAGQVEPTRFLLSRGADPSVPDGKGRTAVYWAARENKLDALKLLVEAYAPISEADVGIAAEMERTVVQAYLKEHLKSKRPRLSEGSEQGSS